jgi:cytochrome bd ubiquinol oxidase subunit II
MPTFETLVAALIMSSLTAYVVLGGADFGGGVWDALASGRSAQAQRVAIARAMGPVWEVNHVWLIFVIVGTWTAFPTGFAAMFTLLAVPITVALAGIVLRGSAFALREKVAQLGRPRIGLGPLFGAASIVTPIFLGAAVGALASGRAGEPTSATSAWAEPFSLAIGALALSMCALLAGVFLTLETEGELREEFRLRAMAAWLSTAILGVVALVAARTGAPRIYTALIAGSATPVFIGALAVGLGTLGMLWARRYAVARVCVVAQVTLVLWAWALGQYPYIVVPTLTIAQAAAPANTMWAFFVIALVGLAILVPSLWYLFRVFKADTSAVD